MTEVAQIFSFFLSIEEAAWLLKISVPTLYGWVHQRRVPFRKHGRRVVFHRDDLEIWSESTRVLPLSGFRAEVGVESKRQGRFLKKPGSLKIRRIAGPIPDSLKRGES